MRPSTLRCRIWNSISRCSTAPSPRVAKTSHLVRGTFTLADMNLPPILFLMVSEGYLTTTGEALLRPGLCAEAIRLGRMLCEIDAREPENRSLLALMLVHDSGRYARVDGDGALVTLEEHDRLLWVRDQMREGSALIDETLRIGRIGPYQLQAAIAAVHAEAENPAETDWAQIAALYDELAHINPTPVVLLNGAVAIGMSEGPARRSARSRSSEPPEHSTSITSLMPRAPTCCADSRRKARPPTPIDRPLP
ncbi:MAG TPA: DUF6596 domain-containing protein [Stellaceae bacterium]|nr:DUF6596 domain-containing protein [Stellaceae bacterium]HMD65852.1 DUF6596 domain-containing protein [Stellaceae bacterium]